MRIQGNLEPENATALTVAEDESNLMRRREELGTLRKVVKLPRRENIVLRKEK